MMNRSSWILCIVLSYAYAFPESHILSNNLNQLMDDRTLNEASDVMDISTQPDSNAEYYAEVLPEPERRILSYHVDPLARLIQSFQNLEHHLTQTENPVEKNAMLTNSWTSLSSLDPLPQISQDGDVTTETGNSGQQYLEMRLTTVDESDRGTRSLSNNIEPNCHANNLRICGTAVIDGFDVTPDFIAKCAIKKKFLDCMVSERKRGCTIEEALQIPGEFVDAYRNKIKDLLSSANGCLLVYEM